MTERIWLPPRAELLRVVEHVHRRNAIKELGKHGIVLAEDAPWREIADKPMPEHTRDLLGTSSYAGRVAVNGLFGLRNLRLSMSDTSQQMVNEFTGDYDAEHKHCDISIYTGSDQIYVKLMSDSPPVAIFADDINRAYVENRDDELLQADNDAAVINAVRRTSGDEAIDPVDDETAKSLIYALLNDESHLGLE